MYFSNSTNSHEDMLIIAYWSDMPDPVNGALAAATFGSTLGDLSNGGYSSSSWSASSAVEIELYCEYGLSVIACSLSVPALLS